MEKPNPNKQLSLIEDLSAEERIALIQETYGTLSDREKNQAYNRLGDIQTKKPPPPTASQTATATYAEPERADKKRKRHNVYQDYFGLSEKPFDLTPDPKYLYLSAKHKEVLAHLLYGMQENNGFLKIVGEVGTGKTTLCRSFLRELHDDFNIAYIFNPCVDALELLQSINAELGLPAESASKKELTDILNVFLLRQRQKGHRVVVIIDEAQNLAPPVLEQLRLISNLETETEKLIQIVLIGQPELDKLLGREELRQLRQRITVQWELLPMNLEETRGYLHHRLNVALGRGKVQFSRKAVELLYRYSQGIPRMINLLADRSLLIAYTMNTKNIAPRIVRMAANDVGGMSLPLTWTRIFWRTVAPALAIAGLILLALRFVPFPGSVSTLKPETADLKTLIRKNPPLAADTGDLIPHDKKDPAAALAVAPSAESAPAAPQNGILPPPAATGEVNPQTAAPEPAKKNNGALLTFSKPETLVTYLASLSHMESKVEAAKWLLQSWGTPAANLKSLDESLFDKLDADYGLLQYELSGDFQRLSTLNYPAMLELTLPHEQGTRFLALTSIKGGVGVFGSADPIEMPLALLDSLWGRNAIIFWTDFEQLPPKFQKGYQGKETVWLQKNLRLLGFFTGREAPLYGQQTVEAVTKFQRKYNINDDGKFDTQSKIMLYNLLDIYPSPKLLMP